MQWKENSGSSYTNQWVIKKTPTPVIIPTSTILCLFHNKSPKQTF